MKRSAGACTLAGVLLLGGASAYVASLGLQYAVVAESRAGRRPDQSAEPWDSPAGPPPVAIGTDPLPPSLPGPKDSWAGGRSHAVTLLADLPPGRYRLELAFHETHESAPPALAVTLNGSPLRELQLTSGGGRPAPYTAINPALTVAVPFTAASARNAFVVTSRAGSWLAFARVRVTSARPGFSLAKALYLLLAPGRRLLWLAGMLLGALFFLVSARRGPGEATAAVVLLALSLSLTFVLGEAVFREWLIRNPSQRALRSPSPGGKEHGRDFTYVSMIQPSSEPEIPYEMRPHLDGSFAKHPLATNSLGMRGPELAPERAPGTLRIVGLGDSVMMGWGVSHEDTALTRTGLQVAATTGRAVETANLGCPSYNTAVETAFYRLRGRRLKPDVVILIFMENDFGFPGLMLEPVARTTLRRSYLREQLRKRLVPRWPEANEYENQEELVSTRRFDAMRGKREEQLTAEERWLLKVQGHYLHMVSQDGVRASLQDLAGMLREDGAAGVVVYNPINLTVGDPASYEKQAGWLLGTARELGLAAVDMTPVYERHLRGAGFQRMEPALWVSPTDWHPNAEAHRLIAEATVSQLRGSGVLEKLRAR